MNSVLGRWLVFSVPLYLLVASILSDVSLGQSRVGIVTSPEQPIPSEYKTWSMFLVCNPGWLIDNKKAELVNLYQQFVAFGDAIGPENVAIWFSKEKIPTNNPVDAAAQYDAPRAAQYCTRYALLPSLGPYIIVTSHYPDLHGELHNFYRISLAGADAMLSIRLLTFLSDQIVATGLQQQQLDSEQYWRSWEHTGLTLIDHFGKLFSKLTVTINTVFFKVELALASPKNK